MVGSWAASMIEQGMTYGSARTYVRNARSIMTGKTSPTAAIIKALSQLNALRPPSHAEDLTDLELIDIIKQLFAVGATRFAYTAFWMWNSPFRFEDLQWFRRKDFKVSIEGENYSVNVIRTKTVRDLVQGGTYTCPFHFMAAAPAEMIRNALDFVCHGERFTENIFEGEINSFNRALKAAHPRFENDGVPTSYSFRRSFMNRVVEHFRILGDGVVDWDAAAKFTLHSSGDVLRGHYERRISEEEAYQERRNAVALRAS